MKDPLNQAYCVDLLCRERPAFERATWLAALARYCPQARALDAAPASSALTVAHPNHLVTLADARIPAQTLIAVADKAIPARVFEDALAQTFEFPEARPRVAEASSAVLVSDLMSSGLPYRERLALFEDCLRGVLECLPCVAIHWRASGRIVDPAAWCRDFDAGEPAARFFAGAINVRMFWLPYAGGANEGEVVMDTLGLAALGLVDVQCRFHGLDPSRVARVLYNTGWYLFCEGDVIADGHTLDGVGASKWRCRHETSLMGPERVVLDLAPGR